MKIVLSFLLVLGCFAKSNAQKIDNIYVNLYTDSLKKGTYNYINVDGLLAGGKYIPLDSTRLLFSCANATFSGNNLIIPADFSHEKVTIKVCLKDNEKIAHEFDMYIKKTEDPPLRSEAEVLRDMRSKKRNG